MLELFLAMAICVLGFICYCAADELVEIRKELARITKALNKKEGQ